MKKLSGFIFFLVILSCLSLSRQQKCLQKDDNFFLHISAIFYKNFIIFLTIG